jgi:hypothetical protein
MYRGWSSNPGLVVDAIGLFFALTQTITTAGPTRLLQRHEPYAQIVLTFESLRAVASTAAVTSR